VVLVFDSASSGGWTVGTSAGWDALSLSGGLTGRSLLMPPCYACSCFYWKVHHAQSKLLALEISSMEFSTIDVPPGKDDHDVILVETEEGGLGMFTCNVDDTCNSLNYNLLQFCAKRGQGSLRVTDEAGCISITRR
jgi:hypothetical protein